MIQCISGWATHDAKSLMEQKDSIKRGWYGFAWPDSATTLPYTLESAGEDARFNTNGRPAWMNLCFPNSEEENNKGVNGFNNPDPSECYTPWADPNA